MNDNIHVRVIHVNVYMQWLFTIDVSAYNIIITNTLELPIEIGEKVKADLIAQDNCKVKECFY